MSRMAVNLLIGCVLFLGSLCVSGSVLAGQSTFTLGFEGPDEITGEIGAKVEQTYYLTLVGSDPDPGADPHASAWSLGVQADGLGIVRIGIDSIGVDRTWGEQARASGFLRAELTTGPGNTGAVMQAIHSLDPPASLPVGRPRRLAAVVVIVSIPADESAVELRYVDGLRASFGSVDNVIEEDGRAVRPPLTTRTIRVRSPTQYPGEFFSLRFNGPFSLEGEPGTVIQGEFQCVLYGTGERRDSLAEAWSIGLEALGGRITGIDLQGTGVESALTTGFVRNELTAGPGNEGAVSTVVFSSPFSTRDPVSIARVVVEARVPEAAATMTLRYRDGLQGSFGPIINSILTTGGDTKTPLHSQTRASILSSRRCGEVAFGFALENVDSPIPFDRIVGGSSSAGEALVPVREGEVGTAEVYAALVSMLSEPAGELCDGHGTFSWSFAIALDGDADPVGVSFTGTAAERFMSAGSSGEGIVDPDLNEGRKGFVGGVILSFQSFSCLPPVGTVAALRMVIASSGPQESEETVARLSFADTLQSQGGSIHNYYVGPGNRALPPCNLDRAALTLRFRKGSSLFQRGDANADRGVNLSDPVWILGGLFLGDPLIACLDASDADDNGVVSVTDAIYMLRFLFMSGPPPPPPFGKCGPDPDGDADGIGCLVLEPRCP